MGVSVVQNAGSGSGSIGHGSPATVSVTGVTTGNILIVAIGYEDTGAMTGVTDVNGNTYTQIDKISNATGSMATFYAKVTSGGNFTITLTPATSGSFKGCWQVYEFTGQDATTPLGNHGTGTNTNAASQDIATSAGVTGGVSGDLFFDAAYNHYDFAWSLTADGTDNPTNIANQVNLGTGSNTVVSTAYCILAGSYSNKGSIKNAQTFGTVSAFVIKQSGGVVAVQPTLMLTGVGP